MDEYIWRPQPKQAEFLRRGEYEVLYGGAAGGGKSEALVMEALRQVHIPHYKGLIVRKTYPQLSELIDKTYRYYPQAVPGCRYNSTSHTWTFPSGAKIVFGAMQHSDDRTKYQGLAYDYIGFDELTHFTYDEYSYLFSRNRPNGAGTRVYIRATANPGGVGHGWVKERFITSAPPLTTIWQDIEYIDDKGIKHTTRQSRAFVPATVFDNQALMSNDKQYVVRLAQMPEAEKNALLYGDWNSFSGQVFTEFVNDPKHYDDRIGTHVITPFEIPPTWTIWRSMDWGMSRPFSVHWYAIDHDGRMYVIAEYYGCTGTPNVGLKLGADEVADGIIQVEREHPLLKNKHINGVADPAIFNNAGTESVEHIMSLKGVYFEPGENNRLQGKMQVHHRLRFDSNGIPMIYFFSTCKHMIRTLPALVYSESHVEDVDTDGEDHAYDELRYICMRNPINVNKIPHKKQIPYNPLEDVQYNRYDYYTIMNGDDR